MRQRKPFSTEMWASEYLRLPQNLMTRFRHKCKLQYGVTATQVMISLIYMVLQEDVKLELSPEGKKYSIHRQAYAVGEADAWDAYRVRVLRKGEVVNTTTYLDSDFR